jgi:aminoglycoside 3-N-acetyltransferase
VGIIGIRPVSTPTRDRATPSTLYIEPSPWCGATTTATMPRFAPNPLALAHAGAGSMLLEAMPTPLQQSPTRAAVAAGEWLLIVAEILIRQVYWRLPFLVRFYHRRRARRRLSRGRPVLVQLRQRLRHSTGASDGLIAMSDLEEHLDRVLPSARSLVMVHSSADGLKSRIEGGSASLDPFASAFSILNVLGRLVGTDGTLAMPTHPVYRGDRGFMQEKSDLTFRYDPKRNSSSVGLLTELFRRRSETLRSLHPISSLAAAGPLAEELLRGNLNEERPLPHGEFSGYHRFCERNGLIVTLGVPFFQSATVIHVAEEVLDEAWPIKHFFYLRRFVVVEKDGETDWAVRERRPGFARSHLGFKLRRDLLREGILHETDYGGLRVDWAFAGDVWDFMTRQHGHGYPYYLPRLSGV